MRVRVRVRLTWRREPSSERAWLRCMGMGAGAGEGEGDLEEGAVLGEGVEGVEHLDRDQHREGERRGGVLAWVRVRVRVGVRVRVEVRVEVKCRLKSSYRASCSRTAPWSSRLRRGRPTA